jgi:DNA-binding MarR family transcriptional regulator
MACNLQNMKRWTLIAASAALTPAARGVTRGPGTRFRGERSPHAFFPTMTRGTLESVVSGNRTLALVKLDAGRDLFSKEQEVNNLYHRTMEVLLAEESLTPPKFMTLSRLHEIDRACKMSELAGLIFMSPAVMTGIVDRLVNLGMMKRNFNDRDRRVVLLTITERGKSALSRIHERLRDMAKRFSECISASDREAAVRVRRRYAEFLTEELKSLEAK